MRLSQLKQLNTTDLCYSDPGGFDSGDLNNVTVLIQMHHINDPREHKIKLVMKPWAYIKDIKDKIHQILHIPTTAQQLYYNGIELLNTRNLLQCGLYYDKILIDLILSANGKKNNKKNYIIYSYGNYIFPKTIMKATHLAMQGLAIGFTPELAMDGTGGTYFLKDPTQRKICCFKPQNEEPFGPCNPRGFVGSLGGSGFRKGILSGEGCEREVAVYLLDKDHFSNVPATTLAEIKHPAFKYLNNNIEYKMGSLQEFIRHDDVASDLSPNMFTPHQVHKIVLLDMRCLNTDRNDANILVRKRRNTEGIIEHELIPIDHGYSIPDTMEIAWCDWCWYNWPQLKIPLSETDRQYILGINIEFEIQKLVKQVPLRPACRRNLYIAGLLVERGVRKRILLYDLARIMCRDDMDIPSKLETMYTKALHQVLNRPIPKKILNETITKNSLRIDTTLIDSTSNGLKSPPGFWASFDPFNKDRNISQDFSPRTVDLPSWEDLSHGFHSEIKDLFSISTNNNSNDFPIRCEKEFFIIITKLIDIELDLIWNSYKN